MPYVVAVTREPQRGGASSPIQIRWVHRKPMPSSPKIPNVEWWTWVPPLELRLWNGPMPARIECVIARQVANADVNPIVDSSARSCWASSVRSR
jgi:hypothetical protein